jgi:hypothetical protein
VDWIQAAQDRDELFKQGNELSVFIKAGNFLSAERLSASQRLCSMELVHICSQGIINSSCRYDVRIHMAFNL